MSAYLQYPFASIGDKNYLDRGAGGQIFAISKRVAFKCPTKFGNPAPSQEEEMEESAAKIEHEKSMHELSFFMERMEATLRTRIGQYSEGHVPSDRTKARWITQIASALSWIEGLGFVHGDRRPANTLLTANENIRLADFDTSVKIGEELQAASEPFIQLGEDFETPQAGSISEQFALGSCIYTIRFGHIPLDGLDPPEGVQKLMKNELPSTENDTEFGDVTVSCWQGQYASISAAYDDIKARCDGLGYDTESFSDVSEDSYHDMASLLAECEDFVSRERGTAGGQQSHVSGTLGPLEVEACST
ncbi:hypothetical protein E4U28_000919 [Claviceps purpurea]|nr:hypothetical protein E4U28_000919 [Claviceps purpurea]